MTFFTLTNTTRYPTPRMPFSRIANIVLGARYNLSVVIVTPQKMRALNRAYRKKDASTDILAFPLEKSAGELFISLPDVEKKSAVFGLSLKKYLAYLYVHGLVHLKGFDHGKAMNTLEKKYCRKLDIQHPSE